MSSLTKLSPLSDNSLTLAKSSLESLSTGLGFFNRCSELFMTLVSWISFCITFSVVLFLYSSLIDWYAVCSSECNSSDRVGEFTWAGELGKMNGDGDLWKILIVSVFSLGFSLSVFSFLFSLKLNRFNC